MDSILFQTEEAVGAVPPATPTTLDFRRVKIHPDHWYPVAWSRELKPGKTLAVRFAGVERDLAVGAAVFQGKYRG